MDRYCKTQLEKAFSQWNEDGYLLLSEVECVLNELPKNKRFRTWIPAADVVCQNAKKHQGFDKKKGVSKAVFTEILDAIYIESSSSSSIPPQKPVKTIKEDHFAEFDADLEEAKQELDDNKAKTDKVRGKKKANQEAIRKLQQEEAEKLKRYEQERKTQLEKVEKNGHACDKTQVGDTLTEASQDPPKHEDVETFEVHSSVDIEEDDIEGSGRIEIIEEYEGIPPPQKGHDIINQDMATDSESVEKQETNLENKTDRVAVDTREMDDEDSFPNTSTVKQTIDTRQEESALNLVPSPLLDEIPSPKTQFEQTNSPDPALVDAVEQPTQPGQTNVPKTAVADHFEQDESDTEAPVVSMEGPAPVEQKDVKTKEPGSPKSSEKRSLVQDIETGATLKHVKQPSGDGLDPRPSLIKEVKNGLKLKKPDNTRARPSGNGPGPKPSLIQEVKSGVKLKKIGNIPTTKANSKPSLVQEIQKGVKLTHVDKPMKKEQQPNLSGHLRSLKEGRGNLKRVESQVADPTNDNSNSDETTELRKENELLKNMLAVARLDLQKTLEILEETSIRAKALEWELRKRM